MAITSPGMHYLYAHDYRIVLSRCASLFGTDSWTMRDIRDSGKFSDLDKSPMSALYKLVSDRAIKVVGTRKYRPSGYETKLYQISDVGFNLLKQYPEYAS